MLLGVATSFPDCVDQNISDRVMTPLPETSELIAGERMKEVVGLPQVEDPSPAFTRDRRDPLTRHWRVVDAQSNTDLHLTIAESATGVSARIHSEDQTGARTGE
jgi:hypothetical protein